jgi:large subunit ribosomal protein L21
VCQQKSGPHPKTELQSIEILLATRALCGNLPAPLPDALGWRASPISHTTNFMAYAIIKTGGKQYKVAVGEKLSVDKLAVNVGEWATFDQVLATGEGESISVGAPTVSGATVVAKVVKQFQDDKVIAFKYKRRKGFHKKKGHRTHKTLVQIVSINAA